MNDAKEIINRVGRLRGDRGTWESHWQEIADMVAPMRADFTVARSPGEKRQQKIYDGTAGMASENLAAGLWGMITNSANEWFTLGVEEQALEEDYEVKAWLQYATRRMRQVFLARGGRFYSQVLDLYADLTPFGTAIFYSEELVGRGEILYWTRPLSECYLAENHLGEVDTVYRRFKYTARQAIQKWGDNAGKAVAKTADKDPDRQFCFIHAVYPRDGNEKGNGYKMPFASCYVNEEEGIEVARGGYHEFPFQCPRWSTRSRSVYGDSAAQLALPDTKMLNQMSKASIIAAEKAADPTILAHDERTVSGGQFGPGKIVYGGVDDVGRRRYEPFITGADVRLTLEMMEQRRASIRDAFFWSLLIMVSAPDQTATEVLARQEEKLRLMGPHLGRLQSEFLDPLIDRTFNIMLRGGAFGRPENIPEALQGAKVKVNYVSPLARAQKMAEGSAMVRAVEALGPIAGIKPEVLDNNDEDEYARTVLEALGTPIRLLKDPKRVAADRAARAQAQQAQMMAGAAPGLAGALKDVAQAGAIAKGAQ